jgi:nicotinate phosphoribosyltransferase
VFREGECVYQAPAVMEIREYCQRELATLWDETRRFVNPHQVYVDLSQELYDMKMAMLREPLP